MAQLNYLDALATELTAGTKLPFAFARETLKMLAMASLGKAVKLSLPWFPNLHRRQYVILVSDTPGAGKGETFRRCQQTVLRSAEEGKPWKLEFISGDSLGSPQWACVALGGDRSKAPINLDHKGITVNLSTAPNGRIVHYDEGRRLMQQDATREVRR